MHKTTTIGTQIVRETMAEVQDMVYVARQRLAEMENYCEANSALDTARQRLRDAAQALAALQRWTYGEN